MAQRLTLCELATSVMNRGSRPSDSVTVFLLLNDKLCMEENWKAYFKMLLRFSSSSMIRDKLFLKMADALNRGEGRGRPAYELPRENSRYCLQRR